MMGQENTVHVTVQGRIITGAARGALDNLQVQISVAGEPNYGEVARSTVKDGGFDADFVLPAQMFEIGRDEFPDLTFAIVDPNSRARLEMREQGRWSVDQGEYHYSVRLTPLRQATAVPVTTPSNGGGNPPPNWGQKVDNIEQLLTNFVVFTPTANDVGADGGTTRAITSLGGTASSDEMINRAFEIVLGTATPEADVQHALGALDTAFKVEQDNGKRLVKWTPPSLVVSMQTSEKLGGAQLVAYNFFRTIGDEAIKLIANMKPLIVDADPERAAALREMMTTQIKRLIDEMGRPDGPRIARMEGLLHFLTEQIKQARGIFGFEPENARILTEEATFMIYKAVEQHLSSLTDAWKNYFNDSNGRYLGTETNKLNIAFDAAVGSAWELEAAMDSVWLDFNERRALEIDVDRRGNLATDKSKRRMSIAALIEWIIDFGRSEGKTLSKTGGKDAMDEIARQAKLLADYVATAEVVDNDRQSNFNHPRVENKRDSLSDSLEQIARLAAPLGAPPAPLSNEALRYIKEQFDLHGGPAGRRG